MALAVVLANTSSAHGAPFTPELEASYSAALTYWGDSDGPPQCEDVDREVVSASEIDGSAGRATRPASGLVVDCKLQIAAYVVGKCYADAIMLHEVGHLFGHGHSNDPSSPMYAGSPSPCYVAEQQERVAAERDTRNLHAIRLEVVRLGVKVRRMRARCRRLSPSPRRRACWKWTRLYRGVWWAELRYLWQVEASRS